MPDVHVVPLANHWICEIDRSIRSIHKTQDEAIKQGRVLAEDQNSELRVHGRDRRIRGRDNHGNDPRDIPG
jgi:Uncharacterized protein conserved in bacteria (DUF2188)